jgi:transcriptional regulator with XRE-family HTH domain
VPDQQAIADAIAANLKRLRSQRGFTLEALAARSGVSRGMLISIEQARTNPSIGTLTRAADALGVSVAQLVELADAPAVRVVRAAETVQLWRSERGSTSTLLVGSDPPHQLELWDWSIAPGDCYEGESHPPGTRELLYVLSGRMQLGVADGEHPVAAGDAVMFGADRPHRYRCDGEEPVRMVLAVAQPPTYSHEPPAED